MLFRSTASYIIITASLDACPSRSADSAPQHPLVLGHPLEVLVHLEHEVLDLLRLLRQRLYLRLQAEVRARVRRDGEGLVDAHLELPGAVFLDLDVAVVLRRVVVRKRAGAAALPVLDAGEDRGELALVQQQKFMHIVVESHTNVIKYKCCIIKIFFGSIKYKL